MFTELNASKESSDTETKDNVEVDHVESDNQL